MEDDLKQYDINESSLFERLKNVENDIGLPDIIDGEEIEPIDMDIIDKESSKDANTIIDNISDLYANREFMDRNPKLKKRIETEIETLRILIKVRKADEVTHDILIKAISEKPSNASLYRAMTEVQKTILSVTTKISEVLTGLETILKNYQTELNFDDETKDNQTEPIEEQDITTYRGSKEFINSMLSKNEGVS